MWRPPITCFEDDFEACIAHLRLPVKHRRLTRTTNLLERLFVEERNRLQSGELFHGSVAARKVISRGPVESYDQVRNGTSVALQRKLILLSTADVPGFGHVLGVLAHAASRRRAQTQPTITSATRIRLTIQTPRL
jgi:hypothetical protein